MSRLRAGVILVLVLCGVGVYVFGGNSRTSTSTLQANTNTLQNDMYDEVSNDTVLTIPSDGFAASIEGGEPVRTILDVRTPEEYEEGHIRGAQNADFNGEGFSAYLETLPRDAPYAIYCRSGNRSGKALEQMRVLGFTDVRDLGGGILVWADENRPVCTEC